MVSNELLKQKILDEAIHGRLVKNDLSLEPIDVEEVSENVPFEIPSNWRWTKLGKCTEFNVGKTPSTKESTYWKEEIDWISISDMIHRRKIISTKKMISKKALKEVFKGNLVPADTLLMSFKLTIGRLSLTTKQSVHNEAIISIYPKEYLFREYLINALDGLDLEKNVKNAIKGKTLNSKSISEILIPIPPLKEQQRIVEKIEELFSLIDKKENNDNEKEKLKLLLKDKILDEAIHGRLVKNDSTLEPIEVEEIKDNVSFEIPNNWKWSKLKKIVEINPRNKIDDNIKVDFIEMSNIKAGYLNEYQFEEKQWKNVKSSFTHIKQDDVIIAKITPCFQNKKSVYLYNLPNKYGAATTELHVLRNTYNKIYMPYLLWFVKRNNFIEEGKNHFTGTAGQLRIPKKWLEDLKVPIPPLEEQKRIVEKIENLFALIDKL